MLSARDSVGVLWLACCCALAADGCDYPDYARDGAEACGEYALSTCQTLQRCGEALIAPYGSFDGCRSSLTDSCLFNLSQPDVLSSSAGVRACGDVIPLVSCDALLNRELPPECGAPHGKRSDGAACSAGAQCASGRCARDVNTSGWGGCRELALHGEVCSALDDCADGLVCSRGGQCVALTAQGEACGELAPCRSPLACVDGLCAVVSVAAKGCNATGCDETHTGPANGMRACQAFSQALCNRLSSCSARLIDGVYVDLATCTVRNAASCLERLATPDVVSSAVGLDACTQLLAAASCGAVLENGLPVECQLAPGMRSEGAACVDDAQCTSTRCARTADAACGMCMTLARADEACRATSDCAHGLVCSAAAVCQSPTAATAACDDKHPCAYPLTCTNGQCSAALGLGKTCDITSDHCDRYAGLACSGSPATCTAWLTASRGQTCGYTPGGWAVCDAGGTCRMATGTFSGTCEGPAADAAACGGDTAPACLTPARCIGGICRIPRATECP